jgi:hypothetical protein
MVTGKDNKVAHLFLKFIVGLHTYNIIISTINNIYASFSNFNICPGMTQPSISFGPMSATIIVSDIMSNKTRHPHQLLQKQNS